MTSDECLCSDDSSEIDKNLIPSLSLSEVSDFIQEFLHQKCKVLKLIRDQISSRNSQNYVPEWVNSTHDDNDNVADHSISRREKREVIESQSRDTTISSSDPIVQRQQIFRNSFHGVLQKISSCRRLLKWPLYIILSIAVPFWIVYACNGFCVPNLCSRPCPIVV